MEEKRNKPCPCGSGKRYKKCCGVAAAAVVPPAPAAASEPPAEYFFQRASLAAGQGHFKEAEDLFRRALAIRPDFTEAYHNLGVIQEAQGLENEAEASYRQALELDPDYINALINLGSIFIDRGRKEEALVCLRKVLTLKPDYAPAYKNLSLLIRFTDIDADIHAMKDLYAGKSTSDMDRIHLGFALGKAYGDLRDYGKSFDFILEANRLKRKTYQYRIEEDRDFFDRIKKTFSHDFFSSRRGSGCQEKAPIFILGMPRSGTTLVEQILASHSNVFGAGELTLLREYLSSDAATGVEFPEGMLDLDSDDLFRMGADYIEKIRRFSNDALYITDKFPHNFLRVGLIKAILPNAKVIHCMRNPMDSCFSIFKNDFTGTHKYAYEMTELGQYFKLYLDLMEHWARVLPGFMYPLRYEELVADQENQIKKLIDYCGLPWEEACLFFYETKRSNNTASSAQVRRPIYKESVELWRRYEKQLAPLQQALYG